MVHFIAWSLNRVSKLVQSSKTLLCVLGSISQTCCPQESLELLHIQTMSWGPSSPSVLSQECTHSQASFPGGCGQKHGASLWALAACPDSIMLLCDGGLSPEQDKTERQGRKRGLPTWLRLQGHHFLIPLGRQMGSTTVIFFSPAAAGQCRAPTKMNKN